MAERWKERRNARFVGDVTIGGAATITGAVTQTGALTLSNRLVLPTEAVTGSSVAQTLSAYGVSFVTYGTSGKTNNVILPVPPAAGTVKYVFVINNTTPV